MQHFSPSAERNKMPILTQLTQWLKGYETVLEIGSGSGQHGLFFASHFPAIRWQCSDRQDYLSQLADNIRSAGQGKRMYCHLSN